MSEEMSKQEESGAGMKKSADGEGRERRKDIFLMKPSKTEGLVLVILTVVFIAAVMGPMQANDWTHEGYLRYMKLLPLTYLGLAAFASGLGVIKYRHRFDLGEGYPADFTRFLDRMGKLELACLLSFAVISGLWPAAIIAFEWDLSTVPWIILGIIVCCVGVAFADLYRKSEKERWDKGLNKTKES